MPEISPRLTYSPEGILELKKTFPENANDERLERILEPVSSNQDYELFEDEHEFTIKLKPFDQIPDVELVNRFFHKKIATLIETLAPFTYQDFDSDVDGVFSLDYWGNNGANGVVYPQLQRWLNADMFDEELAKDVFDVMAMPYGIDEYRRLNNGYRYEKYKNGVEAGRGQMSVNVMLFDDDFEIMKFFDKPGNPNYRRGRVKWRWPNISTVGSCACWGVDGMSREDVILHEDSLRLYEMSPHNVDGALQSLSLVLGMGRIAYEAAKYTGTEDVLEKVEWED